MMVVSLLPDTSNVPSDEKVRDCKLSVCTERTAVWLPVSALKVMISPSVVLVAMVLFQYARADVNLMC